MKKKRARLKRPFKIILGMLCFLLILSFYMLVSSYMDNSEPSLLSNEVIAYEDKLSSNASNNNISEYLDLLKAIMMQESGGRGNDPMQSSECEFNQQYQRKPNAIDDVDYSIEVGVKYFAKCLDKADVKSPSDQSGIYLALQAYNYGIGYIKWANDNYQGYSYDNAIGFSEKCKQDYSMDVYGDSKYVYHVLRYYSDQSLVDNWLELYH